MKYLLVLAVVALFVWVMFGRSRKRKPPPSAQPEGLPAQMVSCAHCGLHLPQADAVLGAGGQPYCDEAHRVAGPR